MRKDVLDRFVSELSQSSAHTRISRTYYARMFLEFAGDRPFSEWKGDLVKEFLDSLRRGEDPYSQGSIRMIYGIVKRVFDCARSVHETGKNKLVEDIDVANPVALAQLVKSMALPGPTWDLGKRSAPKVTQEVKPAVSMEDMRVMIHSVREKGRPDMVAFLALSSVYGLRREELLRVHPEHFKPGVLWVDTLKGGEKRDQLLAPELVPFLKKHDWSRQYSLTNLTTLYYKIEYLAGLPHEDGAGWHAIRRLLDTELVRAHGQLKTHIFLRWKIGASSEMSERYYSEPPLEIDKHVLAKHPILEMWRE